MQIGHLDTIALLRVAIVIGALAPVRAISFEAYRPRLELAAKSGQWKQSLSLLSELRAAGGEVTSGAYAAALSACARANPPEWRAALDLIRTVEQPTPQTYGAAISACRMESDVVLTLLDEMRERGVELSAPTATAAINSLGAAGEWERALRLFREYESLGEPADAKLLHATMMACARAGREAEAVSLLRSAAGSIDMGESAAPIHHALVVALLQAGRPREARRFVSRLRAKRLPVALTTFHALLRQARAEGKPAESLALFREMHASGVAPTDHTYTLAFSGALGADATWRDAVTMLSVAAHQTGRRQPAPGSASAAASAASAAASSASSAAHAGPSAAALESLLVACASGAQPAAAEALLNAVLRASHARGAPPPSAAMWKHALEACARAQESAPALRLLAGAEKAGAAGGCEAYATAIRSCRAAEWQTARAVWARMRRRGFEPSAGCALALMQALRRGARWEESLALLRRLRTVHGIDSGVEGHAERVLTAVDACERAGAWRPALDTLRRLPPSERSTRREAALALLARPHASDAKDGGGDDDDVGGGESTGATLDGVHAALSLCGHGGEWAAAMRLLRGMRRDGLSPSPLTFSLLISAAERGQQWGLLLRLYAALQRGALWRGDELEGQPDAVAAQAAVVAHCKLGDVASALGVLRSMRESNLRPGREACERVLAAACRAGEWQHAHDLLQEMLRVGPAPGRAGWEAVVAALAAGGQLEQMREVLRQMEAWGDCAVGHTTLSAAIGEVLRAALPRKRRMASIGAHGALLVGLHEEGERRGLLPPLSATACDVSSLPPTLAVGTLLATLVSISTSTLDARGPLLVRSEQPDSLAACRGTASRLSPLRLSRVSRVDSVDRVVDSFEVTESSLRAWARAQRKAAGPPRQPAQAEGVWATLTGYGAIHDVSYDDD